MTWLSNTKHRIGYYEKTSRDNPAELLIKALQYVSRGNALDIGCGSGAEVKELVKRGFITTAVDVNVEVRQYLENIENVKICIQPIETFSFEKYDLVFAKNSLVFLSQKNFANVIEKIKSSLNNEGIFASRLWGINDSENMTGKNLHYTFMSKDKLSELFKDFGLLLYAEYEEDGLNAYGKMKHWHYIDLIVKKQCSSK